MLSEEDWISCVLGCANEFFSGGGIPVEEFVNNYGLANEMALEMAKEKGVTEILLNAIKEAIPTPVPPSEAPDKEQEPLTEEEIRKQKWIVTGDSLCGLSKETAKQIVILLKAEGLIAECETEYEYRDVCGFRAQVSTDIPSVMLSPKRKKILGR